MERAKAFAKLPDLDQADQDAHRWEDDGGPPAPALVVETRRHVQWARSAPLAAEEPLG